MVELVLNNEKYILLIEYKGWKELIID